MTGGSIRIARFAGTRPCAGARRILLFAGPDRRIS